MNNFVLLLVAAPLGLYLGYRLRTQTDTPDWFRSGYQVVVLTVLIFCCFVMAFGIARDLFAQTLSPKYTGTIVDFNTTLVKPYAAYRGPPDTPEYERIVEFTDASGQTVTVPTFMKASEQPTIGTQVEFYLLGTRAYEPNAGRYVAAILLFMVLSAAIRVFYILNLNGLRNTRKH